MVKTFSNTTSTSNYQSRADGASEWFEIGDNARTVAFWFYVPALGLRYILGKWNADASRQWVVNTGSTAVAFRVLARDAGNLQRTATHNTAGATNASIIGTCVLGVVWHDPDNDIIAIELDGNPATQGTAALSGGVLAASDTFRVGTSGTLRAEGTISCLGAWDRMLTEAERLELFTKHTTENVAAAYPFVAPTWTSEVLSATAYSGGTVKIKGTTGNAAFIELCRAVVRWGGTHDLQYWTKAFILPGRCDPTRAKRNWSLGVSTYSA